MLHFYAIYTLNYLLWKNIVTTKVLQNEVRNNKHFSLLFLVTYPINKEVGQTQIFQY